jgi:hypothetical protein
MKKIVEYRKLLNVEKTVALKDLKTIYRNAMKKAIPINFRMIQKVCRPPRKKAARLLKPTISW